MREIAGNYPRVFLGLVFGAAAFVPSLVMAIFYVLILRTDGLIAPGSGIPFDLYLILYILSLPPILTGLVAVTLGGRLLREPRLGWLRAGSLGAGIAALSFVLWGLAGELLWLAVDFPPANPTDLGVVDFIAVLGYGLMGLMLLGAVMLGSIVGVWIGDWWHGRPARSLRSSDSDYWQDH